MIVARFAYMVAMLVIGLMFWALVALLMFTATTEACEPEPITPNTPTGIAGCVRWGPGTASMYGPGGGVAMNFCTWELRHSTGCGWVTITSVDTKMKVTVPVVDFCDCYTGTADERIVDLQYNVVAALGLDPTRGLWPVRVHPAPHVREMVPVVVPTPTVWEPPAVLPNTAVQP